MNEEICNFLSLPVVVNTAVNGFDHSSYTMSPSRVLKVVSDRSATMAAACGPFDVPVGGPDEKPSHNTISWLFELSIH